LISDYESEEDMRLKELRQYLKEDKLVKHLTPSPTIDTGYFTDLVYKKESNCLAFVMKEEGEPLTTTKVREFIDACDSITGDTIPDDTLITVGTPSLTKNNNNIVRWICESDTTIIINEKAPEGVAEELNARFADHLLLKESDEDFVKSCFESGFTLEDFKQVGSGAYTFAKRIKEEFGLTEMQLF